MPYMDVVMRREAGCRKRPDTGDRNGTVIALGGLTYPVEMGAIVAAFEKHRFSAVKALLVSLLSLSVLRVSAMAPRKNFPAARLGETVIVVVALANSITRTAQHTHPHPVRAGSRACAHRDTDAAESHREVVMGACAVILTNQCVSIESEPEVSPQTCNAG